MMTLRVLLSFAYPYRLSLALCAGLLLLEACAGLGLPVLGGLFAGSLLGGNVPESGLILAALLGVFAFQAILRVASGLIVGKTSERFQTDLRVQIYEHLQALPMHFHHTHRRGDALALLTHEADQLCNYVTGTLISLAPMLLTVTCAVILMFHIDPLMAAIVACLVPLFYLVLRVLGRKLRPLGRDLQEAQAALTATAEENLSLLPAIKAFTRERMELARYRCQAEDARAIAVAQHRIYALLEPALQFLSAAAVVTILWLAGSRVSSDSMTAPDLVSFLLYAALIVRPVSALATVYGQTQVARGHLAHLVSVLSEKREPSARHRRKLGRIKGEISFENVSFAYPSRPHALQDFTLHIECGETIGIVGPNGAGKSTLAHLLMRLYEPQAGRICIDGVNISSVTLNSLREKIAIVPQHVLLVNGSVKDNIVFGKPKATPSEIERAARLAQAHTFVSELPQGYDTRIGDNGVRLSGGQRQRVALARALVKHPAILVLDEATAMFDPDAERTFLEDCRESFTGRTVIMITHRPASLALAGRILRIERGRLAGEMTRAPAPGTEEETAGTERPMGQKNKRHLVLIS